MQKHDPGLETLLELDGVTLVIEPEKGYWVKFVVNKVPVSQGKPHGIDYSLSLHGPDGERLVGFDNAHPVGSQRKGGPQDHRHRVRRVLPYDYADAATLLADFWTEVDNYLKGAGK